MDVMKTILISPPFGNHLRVDWATPIRGTFTLEARPGLIKQVVKTLRPTKDGWVNKIGLRNPGIKSIKDFSENEIYSVLGHSEYEWHLIRQVIPEKMNVEINLGCPNTNAYTITPHNLERYLSKFNRVIVKLPPTPAIFNLARMVQEIGVEYLHISNTLPTPAGGLSGRKLKDINLGSIEAIKILFPKLHIIGGGGIHTIDDLIDYKDAGAKFFSISTMCFSPIKFMNFSRSITHLEL
jgi:dihydroorotate dehydrogenase